MLKHPLALLLGAILITSIAAFPTTNAQLPQAAAVTTSSQPAAIQNPTLFQNIDDSFRVQVPEGWVIQDVNNTGSILLEEATEGYGILAQLCPEGEQRRQGLPNLGGSGGGLYGSCEGAQENIIYILRYPTLDTRLQSAFGVSTNSITTDNVLLYHVQKLQEVGYRGIQIVNSTETSVNVTDAQTDQTIATVPAKFVEMTYSTASAPNEAREGYFILTATNATHPNPGMTKGYSIFYEGNSTAATANAGVQTTTASVSLAPTPLPAAVIQVFDSFELIAAPEVIAQAVAQTGKVGEAGQAVQRECDASYPDVCIASPPPNLNCENISARNFRVLPPDPHGFDGNDSDGIGCESGSNLPGDIEGEVPGGDIDCDPSYPDDCIPPPPPDLNCGDDGVPENFEVRSPDPHGFDGDNDGIGCESGSNQPEAGEEEVEEDDVGDGTGDGDDVGGDDNGGDEAAEDADTAQDGAEPEEEAAEEEAEEAEDGTTPTTPAA
jgi:hypothetical protein